MYSLNEKETKSLKRFYRKHSKTCAGTYEKVIFSCTGVGIQIKVKCPVCKKKKDVSDYECW